jgi:hypothetical protein
LTADEIRRPKLWPLGRVAQPQLAQPRSNANAAPLQLPNNLHTQPINDTREPHGKVFPNGHTGAQTRANPQVYRRKIAEELKSPRRVGCEL